MATINHQMTPSTGFHDIDTIPLNMGAQFWRVYNSESSMIALYLPLVFWTTLYVGSKVLGLPFHRMYFLHNIHNVGAVLLGMMSLYFDDNTILNERVPILWSLAYFLIDSCDCIVRRETSFSVHAVICLLLGIGNYTSPTCRVLRMNSKATVCELSNPFLHLSKHTRNPLHFALFATVFTVCRVLWIPVMIYQLRAAKMSWMNPRMIGLLGFYGLNLYWYRKIIRIITEGKLRGDEAEDDHKEKKD